MHQYDKTLVSLVELAYEYSSMFSNFRQLSEGLWIIVILLKPASLKCWRPNLVAMQYKLHYNLKYSQQDPFQGAESFTQNSKEKSSVQRVSLISQMVPHVCTHWRFSEVHQWDRYMEDIGVLKMLSLRCFHCAVVCLETKISYALVHLVAKLSSARLLKMIRP